MVERRHIKAIHVLLHYIEWFVACVVRSGLITLRDSEGALIAMSPTMPTNTMA